MALTPAEKFGSTGLLGVVAASPPPPPPSARTNDANPNVRATVRRTTMVCVMGGPPHSIS
jgi:hypothetical protein